MNTDCIIILTRSDGRTFAIDGSPLGLVELTGVDAPTVEVFTEKNAVGDGDVVTGQRVAARNITIRAKARSTRQGRQLRALAGAFFNPSFTFDAAVTYGGVTRTARGCRLKALALPTANVYAPLEIMLTLLCPTGYLDGGGLHGEDLNSITPRLGWPFVSLCASGFVFGVHNYSKTITVNNTGDGPTWARAVFTLTGADTVENPRLTRGDAFVRVLCTLSPGDRLEIDTEKRTVRLNGRNALHLVDRKSSFQRMEMAMGNNTIGFDADTHDNQLSVRVYYAIRYGGI